MKIAVFDVDDTLIIHGQGSESYYTPSTNTFLRDLIESKGFDKIYIYTNGTYGHGYNVCNHLNIYDKVSFIYGRDNLSFLYPNHMKPTIESFKYVNDSIKTDAGIINDNPENHIIYFFDDLDVNLKTAKSIGWNTILIKPNGKKENYIDHIFSNIYSALLQLEY